MYIQNKESMSSPLIAVVLVSIFIIVLLFVWRQRERNMASWKSNAADSHMDVQAANDPWYRRVENRPSDYQPTLFESSSKQTIEEELHKQTCKDTDPLVKYYNKAYKNRWTQVKPGINAVGFTPIAKRCAYPGAPCEWQRKVDGKYELLDGLI